MDTLISDTDVWQLEHLEELKGKCDVTIGSVTMKTGSTLCGLLTRGEVCYLQLPCCHCNVDPYE